MARLAVYLLIALDVVLFAWGQQTREPMTPDLPPPPTMSTVINSSVVVFVGEPVIVPEDVRVTIDCGPLIDEVAASTGVTNPMVTWRKDGSVLTTGSAINVEISDDNRFCIITDTLLAVGGQLGTDGIYSCEVCSTPTQCNETETPQVICGEPHIMEPMGPPPVGGPFTTVACGQDVTFPDLTGTEFILMECTAFNGTPPLTMEVYKDGELIPGAGFPYTIAGADRSALGTYTFVLSTEFCGSDTAVINVLRQGDPPDIDEGPFIPLPPSVLPGDMEVQIGSPGYVIDGSDVTINCSILSGTRPITISWFRNGAPDPTRGNVSIITVTDYDDGDEFTCRAENDVGFDEESTMINVFEPPQILPDPIPTPPPGEISVTTGVPTVTNVDTGTTVTIYCPSSGIDTPSIVWSKDGSSITSGGRFTISTTQIGSEPVTSVLEIDNFQPGDVGTYTCTSTNRAGEATGSTELTQPECQPPAVSSPNPDDPTGPPICADWQVGEFGPCSLECHQGMMTRPVICIDLNNNNQRVDDSFCDQKIEPFRSVSCGSGPCATGWRRGPWSKCSRTCQTGHQMRMVECTDANGDVVGDEECDANLRPVSERFCNGHIDCFPCDDEYPEHCRRLMRMPMGCMGDYARKICCWSCRND